MLRCVLTSNRYVVIIAVVSAFLASMVLLIYGALWEVAVVIRAVREGSLSFKGVLLAYLAVIGWQWRDQVISSLDPVFGFDFFVLDIGWLSGP